MTAENEKEFEDVKELQKEALEKAFTLFEEILESLNNLVEVQKTRLRLIGFYKDMSMLVNIPAPSLMREKPTVEKS